jgi:hypothetical protein
MRDFFIVITGFFHRHLQEISLAVSATFLVLYGNQINQFFKKNVAAFPWWLRWFLFSIFCTLGYGYLTFFLSSRLEVFLANLSEDYFLLVILGIFFMMGLIAERKNQI